MNLPEAIKNLADELSEFPSIGPRQALRLAFYLVGRGQNYIKTLSGVVDGLGKVKTCERCFFVHQNSGVLCNICKNPVRKKGVIMIVEKETDLLSVENTGKFGGRYLILGEIPKTGLLEDQQKLRLQNLKSFIGKELGGKPGSRSSAGFAKAPGSQAELSLPARAEEIILGFNPTSVGDFHASILAKELAPFAKKISRLGRGLPTGGEIEFADDETLGSAIEKRG